SVRIGPWERLRPPEALPAWLTEDGFAGSFGVAAKDAPGEEVLVVRAVVKVGAGGSGGAVIVDVPIDGQVTHRLHEQTGVRLESVLDGADGSVSTRGRATESHGGQSGPGLFQAMLAASEV